MLPVCCNSSEQWRRHPYPARCWARAGAGTAWWGQLPVRPYKLFFPWGRGEVNSSFGQNVRLELIYINVSPALWAKMRRFIMAEGLSAWRGSDILSMNSFDFYFSTQRPAGSPASLDAANHGSSSMILLLLKTSPSYLPGSGSCISWPLLLMPASPLSFVNSAETLTYSLVPITTRKTILEPSQSKKNLRMFSPSQHSSQSCFAEIRFGVRLLSLELLLPPLLMEWAQEVTESLASVFSPVKWGCQSLR